MRKYRFLKMLKVAVIGTLAVAVFGFAVMSLWNILMPGIFAVRAISFWQAIGLFILSKILFGGFRARGGGPLWRRRMIERWEHMTPEEREKFKQGLRSSCGPRRRTETSNQEATAQA